MNVYSKVKKNKLLLASLTEQAIRTRKHKKKRKHAELAEIYQFEQTALVTTGVHGPFNTQSD